MRKHYLTANQHEKALKYLKIVFTINFSHEIFIYHDKSL